MWYYFKQRIDHFMFLKQEGSNFWITETTSDTVEALYTEVCQGTKFFSYASTSVAHAFTVWTMLSLYYTVKCLYNEL